MATDEEVKSRRGIDPTARCELYRLLSEPVRLRLLALTAHEELAVGELADLLREGQPKISRHAAALREAGVLDARRQGTWTLLRLGPRATDDPVVADAVRAGTRACELDGTLDRIEGVLAARDTATREFFARGGRPSRGGPPTELAAYLAALAPLLPERRLAVDVGTGDGSLLEVLAPIFDRVVALDRAPAQLELAAERAERRSFTNVELVCGEVDGPELRAAVAKALRGKSGGPKRGAGGRRDADTSAPGPGAPPAPRAKKSAPSGGENREEAPRGGRDGADVVFAARVLHHAPQPARALRALVELAHSPRAGSRGGAVCILDYEAHDDQALREQQADLWLGFEPQELTRLARVAGLTEIRLRRLPGAWAGEGPDRHLVWQLLVGYRGEALSPETRGQHE